MTEPTATRSQTQGQSVEEEPAQRAFRRYFEQLTAVSMAMTQLREEYREPRWAEYFARSVDCAWGALEARRTQLEFVAGSGSLSRPGYRFIRDRLLETLRLGWRQVARDPFRGEELSLQLRKLENRLLPSPENS